MIKNHAALKFSRFDAATSFFFALILFLGVFVAMMFMLWILSGSAQVRRVSPLELTTSGATPVGLSQDFQTPRAEEVEELLEVSVVDMLDAVTDAVGRVSASLSQTATGATGSQNGANGRDTRSVAIGPGDENVIGRWQRWEIRFNVQGRMDYAKQLDFFGIELAAFGGGENVIESASNLASGPTRTVNRDPESERRLYFSWKRSNPLLEFDRQLLAAAGITTMDRNVVRLIPQALEQQLAQLEKNFCVDNGKVFPDDIAKTVLESRANGDGFAFTIVSQRYRTN